MPPHLLQDLHTYLVCKDEKDDWFSVARVLRAAWGQKSRTPFTTNATFPWPGLIDTTSHSILARTRSPKQSSEQEELFRRHYDRPMHSVSYRNIITRWVYRSLRMLYYHLKHSYGINQTPVSPYLPSKILSSLSKSKNARYSGTICSRPSCQQDRHCSSLQEKEKRTKYQDLYSDYPVMRIALIIGGIRSTLLSDYSDQKNLCTEFPWIDAKSSHLEVFTSIQGTQYEYLHLFTHNNLKAYWI